MLAAYFFRFYELDCALSVGERRDFLFYVDPHFEHAPMEGIAENATMVFYNGLMPGKGQRLVSVMGTVKRIHHIDLGNVTAIDTTGFTYTIKTDSSVFLVDAEEDIGNIYSHDLRVSGWLFTVDIEVHSCQELTYEQLLK